MIEFSVSPGIRALSMYPVPGEEQIKRKYGLQRLIKLASNENCYGPSPAAIQATHDALASLHRYPEVYAAPLKQKLSSFLKVSPGRIVTGNGSTEIVDMIAKTFLQPGENCITALETFPIYKMYATALNALCKTVPLKGDHFDLSGILSAIDSKTRVIFIANPNNPTGTTLQQRTIADFLKELPSGVIAVIDEAYREYSGLAGEDLWDMELHPNVIVLRTFSKVYGLAGLRIGYAICSPIIAEYVNRASIPYSVNRIAQTAAAAALGDQSYIEDCVRKNREQREFLQKELLEMGFAITPSASNFVLMRQKEPARLAEFLLERGILVAPVPHFHIADGIRITMGTPEENEFLLATLRRY